MWRRGNAGRSWVDTSRLTVGLEAAIPDLEARVDHILTTQVYGIAITHLTSLLARRSLYCSKWANGPHSIARSFDDPDDNISFERTEHTWAGGTDRVLAADEHGNPGLTHYGLYDTFVAREVADA